MENHQTDSRLADTSSALSRTHLVYDGRTMEVVRIILGNLLLSVPTLGFYRFWGKTRLRRYVWSHVNFHEERVEYAGTARELFIGFLVALAVFIPFAVLSGIAESRVESTEGQAIVSIIELTVLFFLIHVARYRARRYRLNRTSWRGIRGAQTGAAWRYGLAGVGYLALSLVTVGLTLPVGRTHLQRVRTANTWFGDERFEFDARARLLMPTWLACWLLFVPSLGLSYLWYRAAEFRVFAAHSRCAGLSFESGLAGGSLLRVFVLYAASFFFILIAVTVPLALIIGTTDPSPIDLDDGGNLLGAGAMPGFASIILVFGGILVLGSLHRIIALQRLLPLVLSRLTVIGTADFEAIAQSQQEMLSRGEGLADAFDAGEF